MTLQASVSMSWVNTVLSAAQRLGVAHERLLAAAEIVPEELALERWPVDHITRLWRAAAKLTGDPAFGLKAGEQTSPANFNVVGHLLQSAATLREAITLAQKYQRLISDGGRLQIIPGPQASWLVYHPRQGQLPFSPHQIEAVLAALITITRWLVGSFQRPLKAQFSQSALGAPADYHRVFRCPVEFDQAFSGVLIDNASLDSPLASVDSRLASLHRQYATARLAALSPPGDLLTDLRRWIDAHLHGQMPTRAMAAQAVGLSQRTLARRMQALQIDFSTVLDQARRDAALQAVAAGEQSLVDIGQRLGFAEPSTFWRAFRRWTGMTPAQWRRQRTGQAEQP